MEKMVEDLFTEEIMNTAFQQFSIRKEVKKLGDFVTRKTNFAFFCG